MRASRSMREILRAFLPALLWLAAALHAARTAALAVASGRRMTQRAEWLRQVHPALERWTTSNWQREQWLDVLQGSGPFAFGAWWQRLGAGLPAPGVREGRTAVWNGRAETVALELEWSTLALEELGGLLGRLADEEPPVRVAGLRVDPLREAGHAAVALRLELLAHAAPGAGR